jgi:hypothetical protein
MIENMFDKAERKRMEKYDNEMRSKGHKQIVLTNNGRVPSELQLGLAYEEIRKQITHAKTNAFLNNTVFIEKDEIEIIKNNVYSSRGLYETWDE